MRITHVVVTDAFAGTERYVAEVARRQAGNGQDVRVVGGHEQRMRAELDGVPHAPASTVGAAFSVLRRGARQDVVHAHLTAAETAAAAAWPWHRAALVSTRHIAGRRGSSLAGRALAPGIRRALTAEVAISHYVAGALERRPDVVVHNGVNVNDSPYDVSSRTVLVLQRLEAEKDTATAVHAWCASGLGDRGWELHVAGQGSQRRELEELVTRLNCPGVRFLGLVADPSRHLASCAALVATAVAEPLGLSVLEAMAAGRPVLAAGAGGHLETLPADWPWLYAPSQAGPLSRLLVEMATDDGRRQALGAVLRSRQRALFSLDGHVRTLQQVYVAALR